MANYSLVANTTFQPFTYQELAMPLDRAELYHEKLAEEYDKLSSQADVLEAMGQNDRDKSSNVYNQYKTFSNDLRQAADDLYNNGLNTTSRQLLTDIRRRYNTDIVPIQNAWQKRKEESSLQIKAQLQHPELRFTRDAVNTSLDEYIKNPEGGFGVVNLNNITAMASDAFKNLAKQIRGNKKEVIDKYNDLLVTSYGVDPNLIKDWQNNPDASPTLTAIMNDVLTANGVAGEEFLNTPNGSKILAEAIGAAKRGAWSAVGEDKTQLMDNFEARESYKSSHVSEDNSDLPTITSDGVGLDTTEHFTADGMSHLKGLKGGTNGLKASYFGKRGEVNPMVVYNEYLKELPKHSKTIEKEQEVNNPYAASPQKIKVQTTVRDSEAAKQAVLKKYRKYGVTEILTKEQYNLLSDMGYNSNINPAQKGARFSNLEKGFNSLVKQKNRFSVNMTDYTKMDKDIKGKLTEWNRDNNVSGRVWEITTDGKLSSLRNTDSMKLKNSTGEPADEVNGIYYDPQYKGKIVFRMSNGARYVATPDIINGELTKMIKDMEGDPRFTPKHIAAAIYNALNTKNKVQGSTDSKM